MGLSAKMLYSGFEVLVKRRCKYYFQGRRQNLKDVPQNFTEVFNITDVTANGVIRRNQHRKEKKLEPHSNH